MSDFIEPLARLRLEAQGLGDFAALWPDAPRGGDQCLALQREDSNYWLLRRCGVRRRSLRHPQGEALLGRERAQIRRCQARQVPVLPVLLHAERRMEGQVCAVLLLQAPAGLQPLSDWLAHWPQLEPRRQRALLRACGETLRSLHSARLCHAALDTAALLLRAEAQGFEAFLCHLQHSRPLYLARRDRLRDLQDLQRSTATCWGAREWHHLLGFYLDEFERLDHWLQWLGLPVAGGGTHA